MKTRDMFIFPPLINSSVILSRSFLILRYQKPYHQIQSIFYVFYLDRVHQFVHQFVFINALNIINTIGIFNKVLAIFVFCCYLVIFATESFLK